MKKVALYSRSDRGQSAARRIVASDAPEVDTSETAAAPPPPPPRSRWRALVGRYQSALFLVAGGLFALALVAVYAGMHPPPPPLTQKDIDAAVLHTLENVQMPSHAAKAY